ncbi:MAG: CRISPR-associated ring nuclease [Anaerolineales bacterium]
MTNPETTLIGMLGGQPQVITLTLDLLLGRGEPISQVFVAYLAENVRYRQAYQRLVGEFSGDRYGGRACRLRALPIALSEAYLPHEVDAAWQALNNVLSEVKADGGQIHLSLSGGRRILSLLAMSVAMLHFTASDRAWHIFTPDATANLLKNEGMLHAPPDAGVRLIGVPVVPWGAYFPGIRGLMGHSPLQVRAALEGLLNPAEQAQCEQVWQGLTARQQRVLRSVVAGMERAQAAEAMQITVNTLDDHKRLIMRACRQMWGASLTWNDLRRKFEPFLRTLPEEV